MVLLVPFVSYDLIIIIQNYGALLERDGAGFRGQVKLTGFKNGDVDLTKLLWTYQVCDVVVNSIVSFRLLSFFPFPNYPSRLNGYLLGYTDYMLPTYKFYLHLCPFIK